MSYTTPQRARLTASSRPSVLLRTNFAQIRRIPPSNTFAVLAVYFARHQIDQKTLIHYGTTQCKLPNRLGGLFYPLVLYGLFICSTSYRTGQIDFHPLALLRLALRATKQARRVSSGTFTTCCISYWTGHMSFLWHFYGLLNCETPISSDKFPSSDIWQLYHSQSAWVGWWSRSRASFDLHALLVWSTGIIATFVSRRLGSEVP